MSDLVIIGAGLSGLFAGALAARRGLDTMVIAQGLGTLLTGTGCIDVHSYHNRQSPPEQRLLPAPALDQLPDDHPYTRLGGELSVAAALAEFGEICAAHNYPLTGHLRANHHLPTAMGAPRATCLAPAGMLAGELRQENGVWGVAHLPHFRDFYPQLLVANLPHDAHIIDLPLPDAPTHREAYASDLAHRLDNPTHLTKLAKAWQTAYRQFRQAGGPRIDRIAFPAILGLQHPAAVLAELQHAFDCPLFEIPIMPPSVPGMRLYNLLRAEIVAQGGQLVLGPTVQGAISRHGLAKISAQATGAARPVPAGHYLLASGGFANGGLLAAQDGHVRETIFDLPVIHDPIRANWTAGHYLSSHPYARFGLRVNAGAQPVDEHRQVHAHNLWACGSILAGADRLAEGSREGIALASAYVAVESIMTRQR